MLISATMPERRREKMTEPNKGSGDRVAGATTGEARRNERRGEKMTEPNQGSGAPLCGRNDR